MNVFKINFEIFRKRFKIKNNFNLIEFFALILFIISLIHIGFILFGKYEDMYLLKSLLFFTIIIEFIFPNYNLNSKVKLKSFFGKLKTDEIEKYYSSKSLIISLIVGFFVYIPYRLDLINLSLFYMTIVSLLFLIVIGLRKIFNKIDFQSFLLLIRFSIIFLLLVFVKKGTGERIKNFANKIPFFVYILVFFVFVYISIKILNSIKSNYIKKHNFSKLLINSEKYFGYNFLYIIRSGNFIKNISLFYTISFITVWRETLENIIIFFAISIVLNGILNLFNIFRIEHNICNFIYNKNSLKNINKIKIIDNLKLHFTSIIFFLPIIYFKLGIILTGKLILISSLITIFSTIVVSNYIQKKNYKYNRNDIVTTTIVNLILTIIGINLIV